MQSPSKSPRGRVTLLLLLAAALLPFKEGCVSPCLSAGTGPPLTRGPFLQYTPDAPDAMAVLWETDLPSTGKLLFGKTAQYTETFPSTEKKTHHEVVLKGLEAGAVYHYRVETPYGFSKDYAFSPFPASSSSYKFLVYGDSRSNHAAHQSVVREMKKKAAAFFIHTGDLVEKGGRACDWDTFFLIVRPLAARIPLFPVIGNHDYAGAGDDLFKAAFALPKNSLRPGLEFFFDTGNARFVVLDNRGLGKKGLAWLDETLAEAREKKKLDHLFVILHQGIQSTGPHGGDKDLEKFGYIDLMKERGVDLAIAGHDHMYERGLYKGLRYMVSAGGGAPLYNKEKNKEGKLMRATERHFVWFEVDGKEVRFSVIRPDGTLIEKCAFEGKGYKCSS